jgi:hypothetical protein
MDQSQPPDELCARDTPDQFGREQFLSVWRLRGSSLQLWLILLHETRLRRR